MYTWAIFTSSSQSFFMVSDQIRKTIKLKNVSKKLVNSFPIISFLGKAWRDYTWPFCNLWYCGKAGQRLCGDEFWQSSNHHTSGTFPTVHCHPPAVFMTRHLRPDHIIIIIIFNVPVTTDVTRCNVSMSPTLGSSWGPPHPHHGQCHPQHLSNYSSGSTT